MVEGYHIFAFISLPESTKETGYRAHVKIRMELLKQKPMSTKKLTVHEMAHEDRWRNMARVPGAHRNNSAGKHIRRGTICEVTIQETGKRTLLAIRGCPVKDAIIMLDSPTRIELGVKTENSYEIGLRPVGWLGYCRWAWNADDPAYRLPAQISLISLFLGIVGLVLGFLSLWPLIHGK